MPVPEIAAIIPCYNGEAFLARAIESALSQTLPVARVIVVDDASTDGSRSVARSFQEAGHPVVLIEAGRNVGPASVRNLGIAAAHEPLLAFLDADDRWDASHCETMVKLLDVFPDAALAFGMVRTASEERAVSPAANGESDRTIYHCGRILGEMLYESIVPQSAVMVRRSALVAVGGYRDGLRFSEDYDLWLRLAHEYPFASTNLATCTRVLHGRQASRQEIHMYRGAWDARIRYRDYAARHGGGLSDEAFREICYRAYDRDLRWAWSSRSLKLFRGVLDLSGMVPGGRRLRYWWTCRALMYWPIWRCMALAWDSANQSLADAGA